MTIETIFSTFLLILPATTKGLRRMTSLSLPGDSGARQLMNRVSKPMLISWHSSMCWNSSAYFSCKRLAYRVHVT